jgi:hypothetical protein
MYDITVAVLAFVLFHNAIVYVCAYHLNLSYAQFVAAVTGTGLVVAALLKIAAVAWRSKLDAALSAESRDHELGKDVLYASLVMLVGGFVSSTMLYKKYGLGGWLGLFGANLIANALF